MDSLQNFIIIHYKYLFVNFHYKENLISNFNHFQFLLINIYFENLNFLHI